MAASWLIRRRLRRRWAAAGLLTLIVAVGGGGSLVALGAAQRTDEAYASYLDRAEVGDLVINPSIGSVDSDELVRNLPGAVEVTRSSMMLAGLDDGHPRTRAEFEEESSYELVRGSTDGRHTTMDRPALERGRLPTGDREAFITVEVAEHRGLELGDTLTVSFWNSNDDLFAEPEDVVEPIGVEELTIVGVGTLADEVLPDGLYPRGQVVVSEDVTARYDCTPAVPPVDAGFEEAVAALLPDDCSMSYPYYSLRLRDGARGVGAATSAFVDGADELTRSAIPTVLTEQGISYALIATTTADEAARVERSVRPAVTTLSVLALGTAIVMLVLLGLAVARDLRQSEADQVQWWRLGMTARRRIAVLAVPGLVAVLAGAAIAAGAAWALSPLGPVGTVRSVDPDPRRTLTSWVLVAAVALVAVAAAAIVVLAHGSVHRIGAAPRRQEPARTAGRVIRAAPSPDVAEGVRAAIGGARGGAVVTAIGGLAVGVLTAALVFGSSLSAMVSRPASYGWPWEAAMMGGYGYGRQDVPAIVETLGAHAAVAGWTGLGFGSWEVEGENVVSMVAYGPPADVPLTMAEGTAPERDGEVALGARTASDVGASVGDEVELEGEPFGRRTATVTGIVVLPALGPFQANRAEPGAGMLLPVDMFPDGALDSELTFVGMALGGGAAPDEVLDDLQDDFARWSLEGDPAIAIEAPVRPPEIIDAASMRAAPLLLGATLAAVAALGLAFAVGVSVRARRHEFGTLRALGFTPRQLRRAVRVQAITTTLVALVIGTPLGAVVGRLTWRAFAGQLSVVNDPTVPAHWLAVMAVGALVAAVLAAALPGHAVSTARTGVLRPD